MNNVRANRFYFARENDEFKNLGNITQDIDENLVQEDKNNLATEEQNDTNKNLKSQSGISDNLIIYGHHISSGKMFANLVNYRNYNYYKNHKYIKFSYLDGDVTKEDTYEICFVFKTTANVGGFKFNYYTNLKDEVDYNNFVKTCRNLEFYNTGVETKHGDKFITLVTCEYSQKNGRMVVVGRKI